MAKSIEAMEQELGIEGEGGAGVPDTSLPKEVEEQMRREFRAELVYAYRRMKMAAMTSGAVGDKETAEAQFKQAKSLLERISVVDLGKAG